MAGCHRNVCHAGAALLNSGHVFYRTIVAGIIVFWVVMSGLLIRTQYFSRNGEAQPVPIAFVTRLMFQHEQPAGLVLYSQGHRLDGYLHVQPRHLTHGDDGRSQPLDLLSGSGSFALILPGIKAQRVTLRGVVEVDGQQQIQRLEMTVSLHESKQTGPGLGLAFEGSPLRDEWHYVLKQAGVVLREDSGPLARLLAAADPHLPGLDLSVLGQLQRQQATATRYFAHRGVLRLNGESIDTYVITIQHGETLESTIDFNQLGQILAVKTFAGYNLYDEAIVQ